MLTLQLMDRALDYLAPPGGIEEGAFVAVPLGPRLVAGVVWGAGTGDYPREKLREIAHPLEMPPLRPGLRAFLSRAAAWTLTPLPAMLRLATRVPDLGAPPPQEVLLRLGPVTPVRLTPARARVLEMLRAHGGDGAGGGLGFAAADLARLAGVSGGVLRGLVAQGALIETRAPRDRPFPRQDPAHPGRP
ncbi:MAG: primosomal protein N', partial [Rhodobacteraceae bacterium]|nr:primosomal protein N' [Paracoccaceae bacterium]